MSSLFRYGLSARHVLLCAGLAALPLSAMASDAYKLVELPTLPAGALCANDRQALLSKASAATLTAAENARIAARLLSEQQAAANPDAAKLAAARTIRDQRMDEWRKAEATQDAAGKLAEKPCPPTEAAAPVPVPAPAASLPANLAISVALPASCKPGEVCQVIVDVENKGSEPMPSPLLTTLSFGLEGGRVSAVSPALWDCKAAGEALTCASSGIALQPQTRTRITVDWTLPPQVRRAQINACARIVWPGRGADGVYRTEQIAAVQHALERAGFETGGITGRLTPKTLEAISQLRQKAGIQGAAEITPDLLATLYGVNGALAGDAVLADDSACANAAIEGAQPIAAAPPAKIAKPAAPPKKPKPRPQPQVEDEEEVYRSPAPRVARPAPRVAPRPAEVIEDDEDDVVVYRSPRARYGENRYGTARMVYGPDGPVLVYPDGSYRRIETRPYEYRR